MECFRLGPQLARKDLLLENVLLNILDKDHFARKLSCSRDASRGPHMLFVLKTFLA